MPADGLVSRRCLQAAVLIGGLVPIGAGLLGVVRGPWLAGDAASLDLDSHWRYLSGLLLAIGLGFWSTVPRIEHMRARVRLLAGIVVIGGVGRAISYQIAGAPKPAMQLALVMELVVTPLLVLWQGAVSRRGTL